MSTNKSNENINSVKTNSDNYLKNVKSRIVLQKIFNNLQKKKSLLLIKYSKIIQKRLNFDINDYRDNSLLVIDLKLNENKFGTFINIKKEEESFFHIYFNDNEKEIKIYNLK